MKTILISDIHGNTVALEAVFKEIEKEKPDQIVFLGDLATLGPDPKTAVDMIKTLRSTNIMGNHDSFMLDDSLIKTYTSDEVIINSIKWCKDLLSSSDIDFIKSFKKDSVIQLDRDRTLYCYHGSPKSNFENVLHDSPQMTLSSFNNLDYAYFAGGHTHLPMLFRWRGKVLLNPGSVGIPFFDFADQATPKALPYAEFLIITSEKNNLNYNFRRIDLDPKALYARAVSCSMPLKNWLLSQYR